MGRRCDQYLPHRQSSCVCDARTGCRGSGGVVAWEVMGHAKCQRVLLDPHISRRNLGRAPFPDQWHARLARYVACMSPVPHTCLPCQQRHLRHTSANPASSPRTHVCGEGLHSRGRGACLWHAAYQRHCVPQPPSYLPRISLVTPSYLPRTQPRGALWARGRLHLPCPVAARARRRRAHLRLYTGRSVPHRGPANVVTRCVATHTLIGRTRCEVSQAVVTRTLWSHAASSRRHDRHGPPTHPLSA
jgi:hypothetical protein